MLFGPLAVVETVQRAHQIPGDAADAVEFLRPEVVVQLYFVPAYLDVDAFRLPAEFFLRPVDLRLYLSLLHRPVRYRYRASHVFSLLWSQILYHVFPRLKQTCFSHAVLSILYRCFIESLSVYRIVIEFFFPIKPPFLSPVPRSTGK